MDFPASPLLSAEEAHQAFLELAAGYDELAVTNRKQARQALAFALAGGCLDPNAPSPCRNNDPVLLHVLQNLRVEASDKEGGMEADDPSRQRGLYPGAVQGLTPRVLPVGVDPRFTGTILDFCLNRVQGCEIKRP